MATYQPSSNLQTLRPSTAKSVTFATATVESLPSEQRWWIAKFHLGPRRQIRALPNYQSSTSSTNVDFFTPSGDRSIISAINFSPVGHGVNSNSMAIVCGPRVCVYGGSPSSYLSQALARKKHVTSTASHLDDKDDDQVSLEVNRVIQPDRTIGTGGIVAYCTAFREDGRLLVVGMENGRVLICDAQSRTILRTFGASANLNERLSDGHLKSYETNTSSTLPIRTVGWIPNTNHPILKSKRVCWSGGDDATLRLWDISGLSSSASQRDGESQPLLTLRGHSDAIRSCDSFIHADGRIFLLTASLDHSIRLWDISPANDLINPYSHGNDRCFAVFDHGCPVQSMQIVRPVNEDNQSPIVLSAGGTWMKLWDSMAGSCLATVPTKHSKTITSVCLTTIIRDELVDGDDGKDGSRKVYNRRIVTAGLDGLLRIHSADDIFTNESNRVKGRIRLPYVHGIKFGKAISAMSFSPDFTRLVIGFSDGKVTVRQRAKLVVQGAKRKSNIISPKAGTFSFFTRGTNAQADADDHVVQVQKKKKLQKFDDNLKKFRYADALDDALLARDPNAVLAVIEELGRRRGLILALSNRDEETLEPILSFTANFISNPRFAPTLIGVANLLCDIYATILGQSEVIDELFEKLRRNIKVECATQKILTRLVGQIDSVMYAAQEQLDDYS